MLNSSPPHFESIELVLTYRCTLACHNCIRLAGPYSQEKFNVNNDVQDMDVENVLNVIRQIETVASTVPARPLVGFICLTGGEPTLHPQLNEIYRLCHERLVLSGLTSRLIVNSNGVQRGVPTAEVAEAIVTFSTPAQKLSGHIAMFADKTGSTHNACTHYRKWRIVASRKGFLMCCAAEGYARLAQYDHLWLDHLPTNPWEFPVKSNAMIDICKHCAFCHEETALLEKDVDCPISPHFQDQIKNSWR